MRMQSKRARPLPQCFTPTRFCAGWQQKREMISCFTRVEIAADVLGGVSLKNIHKLCGNHTCMNVLTAGRRCHFGSQPQKTPHSLLRFLPPFPPWSWDSGGTHIPGELGDCIGLRSYHSSCIPRCRENCENAIKKGMPTPTVFRTNSFLCGLATKKRDDQLLYSR